MERDGLVVFVCRREPAVAADACLRTVVVLGLQLLVQVERAGALHGREHSPVQVEDVRFRLQEGLDGSGIRALRVKLSLRRLVQFQDVRFARRRASMAVTSVRSMSS